MQASEPTRFPRRILAIGAGAAAVAVVGWLAFAGASSGAKRDVPSDVRGTPFHSTALAPAKPKGAPIEVAVAPPLEITIGPNGVLIVPMQLLVGFKYPKIIPGDELGTMKRDTKGPTKFGPDPVPKAIRDLAGKRVSLEGFMIPIDYSQEETTDFVLSGCPPSCCFGAALAPNGWIAVTMSEGKKANVAGSPRIAIVEGVLKVNGLEADDEAGTPVFELTADVVTNVK